MAELRDTIVIIDKRDAEIRLLAGLPDPDSGPSWRSCRSMSTR